jgi:hypothetical protein
MDTSSLIANRKKKKIYEFHLLKTRKNQYRPDFIIVSIVSIITCWTFGWRMTDMEDLMAVGMLILAITFNGVLLLLNFWSVNIHELFGFVQVDAAKIEECTHVRVTMTN